MISIKYEIKKQVIGEDPDLEKSGRKLNRVIEWNRDGNHNRGRPETCQRDTERTRVGTSESLCDSMRRGEEG